jgi:hypothetical protein
MWILEARAADLCRLLETHSHSVSHYVELEYIKLDTELASLEARQIWFEQPLWVQR